MYKDKKILVVVPARCGSKGIKLKNIREIGGKPMVALAAETVKQLPEIDRAIVSTDCNEVAYVAKQAGLDVPFMRPKSLSGDVVSDLAVLTHAVLEMERLDDVQYDLICMLQPTCPLRKSVHVQLCLEMISSNNFDAVWTVSMTDSKAHPLKQLVVNESGEMDYYDQKGGEIIARQQLKPLYHRNGAAYIITRNCLLEKKSIKGESTGAVVIEEQLANIDSEQDIKYAEFLLAQQGRQKIKD